MPLRLFFTQTEHEDQIWGSEGCGWAVLMRDQMLQATNAPYEMCDRPEEADIIVFWEPHQDSQVIRIPRLRAHPLVHEFPNKVFVISVEDSPLGLLPGLYTSLPAWRHHPYRHRTFVYYRTENPYLSARRASRQVSSPPNLATFSGANSHRVRGRLLDMADSLARQDIIITSTPRRRFSANPNDPQLKPFQLAFIDAILDAKFSLCPRGNGAGSYRLQESMALGRVPVIISDDWVPVADLDWERFAVFVAEKDLHDLPTILREHEPRWKEMGDLAVQTYEYHFSKSVFAPRAVEQIVAIFKMRTHNERDFFSQWDRILDDANRRVANDPAHSPL
jgi:Exostosin family